MKKKNHLTSIVTAALARGSTRTRLLILQPPLVALVFLCFDIAAPAHAVDPASAKQLCTGFCAAQWSDQSDSCNEVCFAAATQELSSCSLDFVAPPAEKQVFWASCEFGKGLLFATTLGERSTQCSELCFSKGCTKFCTDTVKNHTCELEFGSREYQCRADATDRESALEEFWRGCNLASGLTDGSEGRTADLPECLGKKTTIDQYALVCGSGGDASSPQGLLNAPYLQEIKTGNVVNISGHDLALARKACANRKAISDLTGASCGNGLREADEYCDGERNLWTCEALGFAQGGFVACDANCLPDTSSCLLK